MPASVLILLEFVMTFAKGKLEALFLLTNNLILIP